SASTWASYARWASTASTRPTARATTAAWATSACHDRRRAGEGAARGGGACPPGGSGRRLVPQGDRFVKGRGYGHGGETPARGEMVTAFAVARRACGAQRRGLRPDPRPRGVERQLVLGRRRARYGGLGVEQRLLEQRLLEQRLREQQRIGRRRR